MELNWIRCGDHWCGLKRVNLENVTTFGVCVIWSPSIEGNNVVRVGQGNISERLAAHRKDLVVTSYGDDLVVTWAKSRDIRSMV